MSRLIHGADAARLMPIQALSKNLSNVSAYHVQCVCTKMLGLLGQFTPDDNGRRIIRCDDLTPEQVADLVRSLGLVMPPNLQRISKGCGAITILGKEGQVLRVFEKGSPAYTELNGRLEAIRKKNEHEAALKAQVDAHNAAMRRGEGAGGGFGGGAGI